MIGRHRLAFVHWLRVRARAISLMRLVRLMLLMHLVRLLTARAIERLHLLLMLVFEVRLIGHVLPL